MVRICEKEFALSFPVISSASTMVVFAVTGRIGALSAKAFVIVVAKFGSFPSAVASSFRVSSAAGDEAIRLAMAVCMNAVVASCVVFVPGEGVGAVGVPVSDGEESGAFKAREESTCVFVYTSVIPYHEIVIALSALTVSSLVNSFCISLVISATGFKKI